jgi:hypothetical protein
MKTSSHPPVIVLVGIALLMSLGIVTPARAQDQPPDIQQAMTPAQFKAAGLQKLTPEELAKLNAWLQGYRETAEKKAETRAEKKAAQKAEREKANLIVSRYNGFWNGVAPGEIIELEDGSKWKLANADEHYGGHADHPGVAVWKAGLFGWKMRISRIAEFHVMPVH